MTRCGTPCWTAPEVIRGQQYDQTIDIYAFGMVIWEVLTRKQPFAGSNFMNISLEVLAGERPPIPSDGPNELKKLIKHCWHDLPSKRPSMEQVVDVLASMSSAQIPV